MPPTVVACRTEETEDPLPKAAASPIVMAEGSMEAVVGAADAAVVWAADVVVSRRFQLAIR